MDKQGRILNPMRCASMRDWIRKAILVGVDTRNEIWDAEALQSHEKSMAGEI